MSNVDINGQARSQTQAHELSGSLTPCEDAQNKRRHPDRSRTKKIVSVSQTALSNAKPLRTCNYTSNNGRSIRGLEILPTAHARTHTHTNITLSAMKRSLVSAEVCMWLGLSHRQAKHNENTLELMGSLTPCEDTKEM